MQGKVLLLHVYIVLRLSSRPGLNLCLFFALWLPPGIPLVQKSAARYPCRSSINKSLPVKRIMLSLLYCMLALPAMLVVAAPNPSLSTSLTSSEICVTMMKKTSAAPTPLPTFTTTQSYQGSETITETDPSTTITTTITPSVVSVTSTTITTVTITIENPPCV